MECDICQRPAGAKLHLNCTSCARNSLYFPRIQHAQLLLETESIGREVEKNVEDASKSKGLPKKHASISDVHPTFAIERATAERIVSSEKTEKIMAQAEMLRAQIEDMKQYLVTKRAEHSQRRKELAAARERLTERQKTDFVPVQKNITRSRSHWDTLHAKIAEARACLCKETAHLYGLQQRKRRKGTPGRDLYFIGGLPVPDLRDLNHASPTHVSASLTSLAHLVHLASHYLSLRLPAEITLPHRDYPLPTIFSPISSYNGRNVPYPGFTPTHSSNSSPSASRVADARSLPRPRPLHIEKKLALIAKEEPVAYASFVEGVTLLAWDIAWICKSQGFDVGKTSWEDVHTMGKNLWQLLLGSSPAARKQLPLNVETLNAKSPLEQKGEHHAFLSMLGHFSHGSAHSFLPAAEGLEHMSGWRLQSALKVIDRVKAMLQNERDGAEWQLLEEDEWDDAEAQNEPVREGEGEAHIITAKEAMTQDPEMEVEGNNSVGRGGKDSEGKPAGTSGWTKLKSRGAQ